MNYLTLKILVKGEKAQNTQRTQKHTENAHITFGLKHTGVCAVIAK